MKKTRVLMVLSRPYTDNPTTGREKINAFVHASISQLAEVRIEYFRHILATRNRRALLKAGIRFIQGLLTTPQPLQALLFGDQHEIQRIESIVHSFKPNVVLVESERSYSLILALRQRWPHLRIVCDFDDLMSRRMTEWARHGNAISFGYMARFIPDALQKLLAGPLAGFICRYEASALKTLEKKTLALADSVILLSSKEVELLKEATPTSLHSKIKLIPPACEPKAIRHPVQPIRFVFIGSDTLLQNRLTIEYLIDLWHQCLPQTSLAIYGRMAQAYANIPTGVEFKGFAESLATVYTDHSVLLSPSFVKGGVKTKILEAMEHGTLVVGNAISFEGIVDADEASSIPDQMQLVDFVKSPAAHMNTFITSGQRITQQVSEKLNPTRVAELWQSCLITQPTFTNAQQAVDHRLAKNADSN